MNLPERFIESIITTSTRERNMFDLLAMCKLKMLELRVQDGFSLLA